MMEVVLTILVLALLTCFILAWLLFRGQTKLRGTQESCARVRAELKDFRDLVDHEVMILKTDLEGNVSHASQAFAEFMGYDEEELKGRPFRQILQPEALPEYYHDLWSTLAVTFGWRDEISGQKKSGKQFSAEINVIPVRDPAGNVEGYHAVVHDISSRKQLEILSITDELTGLNNRRHFNQCFVRELIRTRRSKESAIFAMVDVDHFKRYNDYYGHQKGDEVLKSIGELLKNILRRPTDYVFRLGGEEFGILLLHMTSDKAEIFLEKIRMDVVSLGIPHEQNGSEGVVTISMGAIFAEWPDPDKESQYFREADANLYIAKGRGRNQLVFSAFKSSDSG